MASPVLGFTQHTDATSGVTIANNAYNRLEVILAGGVKSRSLTAPPGGEAEGDAYIVGASATGDWNGKDGQVAYYEGGTYKFIAPREGMRLWVDDEDTEVVRAGSVWHAKDGTQTLVDAATIAWDTSLGAHAIVTLGGNRTMGTPTNPVKGWRYSLRITQDGTGSRLITWPAFFKFNNGALTLSTVAAAVDIVEWIYDGTSFFEWGRGANVKSIP